MNKSHLPLLIIGVLFVVIYRLMSCVSTVPINSTPIIALLFCGALFSGRSGVAICAVLYLISYPLLNLLQNYPVGLDFIISTVAYAAVAVIGLSCQGIKAQPALKRSLFVIGSSLACATGFYLFTNMCCWVTDVRYSKDITGFLQAQWGHPTLPLPTWVFLKNSLISNGAFAILLCASHWKVNYKPAMASASTIN